MRHEISVIPCYLAKVPPYKMAQSIKVCRWWGATWLDSEVFTRQEHVSISSSGLTTLTISCADLTVSLTSLVFTSWHYYEIECAHDNGLTPFLAGVSNCSSTLPAMLWGSAVCIYQTNTEQGWQWSLFLGPVSWPQFSLPEEWTEGLLPAALGTKMKPSVGRCFGIWDGAS